MEVEISICNNVVGDINPAFQMHVLFKLPNLTITRRTTFFCQFSVAFDILDKTDMPKHSMANVQKPSSFKRTKMKSETEKSSPTVAIVELLGIVGELEWRACERQRKSGIDSVWFVKLFFVCSFFTPGWEVFYLGCIFTVLFCISILL